LFAFSPDGQYLATGSIEGVTRIWRVADGSQILTFPEQSTEIFMLAFSPDGQTLATNNTLWDLPSGHLRFILPSMGTRVAFSSDGQTMAVGWNVPHAIEIRRVQDGALIRTLPQEGNVLTFTPDGRLLAVLANSADSQVS